MFVDRVKSFSSDRQKYYKFIYKYSTDLYNLSLQFIKESLKAFLTIPNYPLIIGVPSMSFIFILNFFVGGGAGRLFQVPYSF